MASGTFAIPMSQYYAKSSALKSKAEQVSQDVTNNFLNRVNNNLSQLDPSDQAYLENVEPYITAKNLNDKLQTEHLRNLEYMSTENSNNPLYQLVERDKHYSSMFQDIAANKNTGAVTEALNSLDLKFADKSAGRMINKLLDMLKDTMSSDLYMQITKLAGSNPTAALGKLLNNTEFIAEVSKSKSATDFFLEFMIKLEKGSQYPQKVMEILFNSDTFINILSKASTKVQGRVLNAMVNFSENGWKILKNKVEKLDMFKSLIDNKALKTISKFGESKIGKGLSSPWFSMAVKGGFSAINAYFDRESETYKNVGKSVIGGVIDGIASVGPIDGALIGAQILGPEGAVLGLIGGITIQSLKYAFPNSTNIIKESAYCLVEDIREIGKGIGQKIDSVIENAGKTIGNADKAIENGINQIKDKASQLLDNLIPDIPKIDFGWFR